MTKLLDSNAQTEHLLYDSILKTGKGFHLSYEEMHQAITAVMDGKVSDLELAQLLLNLSKKGETADEITAVVEVLLDNAIRLGKSFPHAIDNCGTGGDKSGSFNISTTSAFVMAGAGATVAKHGNKSITSKSGSSDVLEALGMNLDLNKDHAVDQLENIGIAFLYAPQTNPKLKQIMKVRHDLGVPTLFNMIGPLTNPVDIKHQYVGVYKREMLETIAQVLKRLGREKAVVVNGAEYMDEVNLIGENHIVYLEGGKISYQTFRPTDFGLPEYDKSEILGGDKYVNKEILLNILQGKSTPAQRDTVLLNAGVGLYAADQAQSIQEGIDLARESIDSGAALDKLKALINY